MGLATDSIFVVALQSNAELMEIIGGAAVSQQQTQQEDEAQPRLYGTAIPMPDEDAENVSVPYIIVTFDGLNNDQDTKDEPYESNDDRVNIGVEVTAKTLEGLHDLTQMVRNTILSYFRENVTSVYDYTMSADAIQYDSMKPCYWQVLRYQCEVNNLTEKDNGEDD